MKIDQYQGFVFDGKGYIKDHQMCREVITFDFPMVNSEKAEECLQLCLDFLNKDGGIENSQERYSILIPTLDIKDNMTDKLIRGSELAELLNEQYNEVNHLLITNDKLEKEVLSLRRQLTIYRKIKRLVKENE